ncbi:DUF5677 domain-containing protein [Halobacillus salinarum]|uniref:DUF5677 domain-containing protein n=1 Tax=Halobacillus salinarum TaxID=2932257 RepID=A0ABY4EL05_9BACI|nr:DUF5677 domain-containing protein [Halobacillus salinarum]UOQ44839.1 DUF5677 domain-containing protein [Halobacillus salinarum]
MEERSTSKLSDHKYKKGKIITPMNSMLGDKLALNSWTNERLPEYLWLGLILHHYGRKKGLIKVQEILSLISGLELDVNQPKISIITNLDNHKQIDVYKIINSVVNSSILAPLTILLRGERYEQFNEYFYDKSQTLDYRISKIEEVLLRYYNHQSNEATDLRYLAICLPLFKGRVKLFEGVEGMIEALKNYSVTEHEDERMRFYRPAIRSFEGMELEEKDNTFISNFWKELGLLTDCNPVYINYEEQQTEMKLFIKDTRELLEHLILVNKEELLKESKFNVLIGSTAYIKKIFDELIEKDLGNSILGRHAYRTILEVYIMIKYLIKKEEENPNIFLDYQLYGVGKFKHVLLRCRDGELIKEDTSHIKTPIIHSLVNEPMWEEYLDIDVRYFDTQSIKKKFEEVDEKELYDVFYEYNNNYVHGFWGAVRESSMLFCDNPLHQYHSLPDLENYQKLPNVINDTQAIYKKYLETLSNIYEFPEWFKHKYGELSYGI